MLKKIFFTLLILFVAAAVAIFFFGSKLLNEGIRQGVETFGPKVTQTPITLETVDLSVLSGKGTLKGLYVGNPEGFKNENIFELGQIDVEVDIESLLTDRIIIKEIIIRKPVISYEKQMRSSNVSALMANIEAFTGPAKESPATTVASAPEGAPAIEGDATTTQPAATESAAAEPAAPAPQVVIKHLLIEGGSIYVGVLGVGQTIPLPTIEMNNIGAGDERMSPAEMINLILNKVVTSIGPAIAGGGELLTEGGKAIASAATDTVKNLDQTTGESIKAVGDAAEEAVKKTTDSIKSLFGK